MAPCNNRSISPASSSKPAARAAAALDRPQQVGLLQQSPDRLTSHPYSASPVSQSKMPHAARLIFNLRRCDHITDALISLHWLRVPERITFKVATLTYRALHGSAPPYLASLASSFTCVADMPHRRRLRSASTEQLDVPFVGQLSEVVPFLLLEKRCGMACQAKLRRPRRCRCSRTG